MAKVNPQWRNLADQEVLVILQGLHAYISSDWYSRENVQMTLVTQKVRGIPNPSNLFSTEWGRDVR
jgi:hypothetical protein